MTPPKIESTEEEEFDQLVQFYIEKYKELTSTGGAELTPAAACVVLLCAQLERTFTDDDEEDGEAEGG